VRKEKPTQPKCMSEFEKKNISQSLDMSTTSEKFVQPAIPKFDGHYCNIPTRYYRFNKK